ncbi:MAG: hypothetical protein HYU36_04925 [Planctomycetes bacterium]|nr:hypothetical protein [Planctomycetota bacterium]
METRDKTILRELARRYLLICQKEVQKERRDLWRRHNSLKPARLLIYVRAFAWREMPQSRCECEDPFYRSYEDFFRQMLFLDTLGDDFIFEPWATVAATCVTPPEGLWGLPVTWERPNLAGGAARWDPPLKRQEDLRRMKVPKHQIDEEDTARRVGRLQEAIGDLLTINVDRGTVYRMWGGDISTQLGYLRGLQPIMEDMYDRPEWLHEVLAFMRDGILKAQEEAEKGNDWRLSNHQNQAMPYAEELADPAPNGAGVLRKKLWYFCASQELAQVGPRQFDEFMLQYQLPIIRNFALSAYGCCENLTAKIGVLRQIPNLRRIAAAPAANVARCAEQIGTDFVLSYRPNPTDMVAYGFDRDRIRRILRRDLSACRGCHVDITLKDVETVQGDPDRVRQWVQLVREVSEDFTSG